MQHLRKLVQIRYDKGAGTHMHKCLVGYSIKMTLAQKHQKASLSPRSTFLVQEGADLMHIVVGFIPQSY